MTSEIVDVGMTLTIDRETIEVDSISPTEPDPDWSFTDAEGHVHRWVGNAVPTTTTIERGRWWCEDCREAHIEELVVCIQCRLAVEPRTRAAPERQYLRGPARYYLNGTEISEGEAKAVIAKMEAQQAAKGATVRSGAGARHDTEPGRS